MKNILLVEDDQSLGPNLKKFLQDEGHQVTLAPEIRKAKEYLNTPDQKFHLIVLDWMLPDGQGIDLLSELRNKLVKIPIIMLTARTELIDKVIGLETGADDYVTKPFEPRELLARIRAQLRGAGERSYSQQRAQEVVELGELKINDATREVFFEGKKIEMTKMEYDFLKLLAQNPNRAFSREEILNKVWGYQNYPSTRTVDTHVLQIRQKLRDDLIETVRGIGYRLRWGN